MVGSFLTKHKNVCSKQAVLPPLDIGQGLSSILTLAVVLPPLLPQLPPFSYEAPCEVPEGHKYRDQDW